MHLQHLVVLPELHLFVIVLDFCCWWSWLDKRLSRVFKGLTSFEFWVLRFRFLGASFSRFGCFVFEISVLYASVFVFECFVFKTTPSLAHNILNKSFSSSLLPDEWKCTDITPLHKKGSKSLRENYRPISLTSIVCKIGEKVVFDRLHKFWQETGLINNNQ